MEILVVDDQGRIVIPPEITHERGWQPGDQITLVETTLGLLVHPGDVDAKTLEWRRSLSEEERESARKEAEEYWALSEEERDAVWNADAAELGRWLEGDDEDEDDKELDDEGDVLDLSTVQRTV